MDSASTPPQLDIVIPVYNEGENIIPVLSVLHAQVRTPFRVLICYDEESDSTLPAIRGWADTEEMRIVPVKNRFKGAHGAVRSGLLASQAEAVLTYMADDDFNAGIIDTMVEELHTGYDIVVASRFMPGGEFHGCRWPKSFLVRAASGTLYWLARLPARDATNGFRLFSRRLLKAVEIESTQGFTYSIELLVKCHRLRLRITEVPARWYERKAGKSRFKTFVWARAYLRWYGYAFATTYLRKTQICRKSMLRQSI